MAKLIKPARIDDVELEKIRQRIDEMGIGTPNYGDPLSAKYKREVRKKRVRGDVSVR